MQVMEKFKKLKVDNFIIDKAKREKEK